MHSVITGATPPNPLEAFGPFNKDLPDMNNQIPPEYHTIYDLGGKKVEPFYTYGAILTEECYEISPAVNCLLLRCMADQPAHRPTLKELEGWVKSFESIEGFDEPDDYYDRLFGQAPQVNMAMLLVLEYFH